MHAHRVDILNRTHDDAIIRLVADNFHFVFFPAENAFLDQHLICRRRIDAALDNLDEFRLVVRDAAASSAHREGRPDNRRQADISERLERLRQGFDLVRTRRIKPDLCHGIAEQFTVFRLVDRFGCGPDHLDIVFFEYTHFLERERAIERRLPAHGRQQCVGAFLLDDLGDDFRRDWLDIGAMRHVRIGHDRGRIGIDQNDPVALFLERLDGLRARIIKLAGLSDHNRTRADDQDRGNICAFGHCNRSSSNR